MSTEWTVHKVALMWESDIHRNWHDCWLRRRQVVIMASCNDWGLILSVTVRHKPGFTPENNHQESRNTCTHKVKYQIHQKPKYQVVLGSNLSLKCNNQTLLFIFSIKKDYLKKPIQSNEASTNRFLKGDKGNGPTALILYSYILNFVILELTDRH